MTISWYWLVYDISNNRERRQVERCASRYGQRLQKSVFVCVLNRERERRLLAELEGLGCTSGSVVLAELAKPSRLAGVGIDVCLLEEDWAFFSLPLPPSQDVAETTPG
jgi:CRISPR-associated endoribonuclease Cas2